jgi:hypothetical protein
MKIFILLITLSIFSFTHAQDSEDPNPNDLKSLIGEAIDKMKKETLKGH